MRSQLGLAMLAGAMTCFAQPPNTEIDTVQVPPVFLKLTDNSGGIYKYRGKVSYRIIGWSNDRFNVSISLVKDGTGEAVPLTMAKGDVGPVTWAGTRSIHFTCQFNAPPTGTYKEKITIVPSRSDTAQFIEDLLSRLSSADKQTIINGGNAGGVVGITWRDGSYGIGGGYAWPCGEAMASTWDTALAEEGGVYKGQDFRAFGFNMMLGPSVSVVRDGRDGLAAEQYGEDPFVNGKFAAADIRGDQASGILVALKHFSCGPECGAAGPCPIIVSERSLRELYTLPFGMAAREGACTGVMTSATNMVNGLRTAQNKQALTDLLKNSYGFKGFILSDWDNGGGNFKKTALAGLDLPAPGTWGTTLLSMVPDSVPQYLFDDKARRLLWARYKSGCFAPGYAITKFKDSVDNTTHYAYMRRAAREAMILAKNDGNVLPIAKNKPVTLAVVGPWANAARVGPIGSSFVPPKHAITPIQAVKQIGGANVTVTSDFAAADYALVCIGPDDQGESFHRTSVSLPDTQDQLAGRALAAKPGKTILYYTGGSCADSGNWSQAPAIIMSLYPGEDHCLAMAEVLFGDYNPGGKIPFTFPADSIQLPAFGIRWSGTALADSFENVWEGRGYPYFERFNFKPLFCFGHGLSYTTFAYSNLQIIPASGYPGDTFMVRIDVKNTGICAGDEVVQLYVHDRESTLPRRVKELRGFRRVPLAPGETKAVTFQLTEQDIEYYDDKESAWVVEPGPIDVLVGASSTDIRQSGVLTIR
jgi:beta-glucosidase